MLACAFPRLTGNVSAYIRGHLRKALDESWFRLIVQSTGMSWKLHQINQQIVKSNKLMFPHKKMSGKKLLWYRCPSAGTTDLKLNILCTKIGAYVHVMLFLQIEMAHLTKIPPYGRQGSLCPIYSTLWLLMTWRRKEPGYQQSWYWPSFPGISPPQPQMGWCVC